MENKLDISGLFANAWVLFKKNWALSLGIIVVMGLIQSVFNAFGLQIDPVTGEQTGSLGFTILGVLVSLLFTVTSIDMYIGMSRGEKRQITELFTKITPKKYLVYIVTTILFSIMAFIGFMLLFIPGVIITLIFMPYVYLIVDKNMGVIESLKEAARITKGNRINILLTLIGIFLLNLVGLIALFIGLLITIPMSTFVMVLLYRYLIGDVDTVQAVDVEKVVEEVIEVEEVQ